MLRVSHSAACLILIGLSTTASAQSISVNSNGVLRIDGTDGDDYIVVAEGQFSTQVSVPYQPVFGSHSATRMRNTTLTWTTVEALVQEGFDSTGTSDYEGPVPLGMLIIPNADFGDVLESKVFVTSFSAAPYPVSDTRLLAKIMGSSSATPISMITVYGRDGSDWIKNLTDLPSNLYGEGGNDDLEGGSNDDDLYGGNGNDNLFGFEGDDWMNGEAGNDKLVGGPGEDTLKGATNIWQWVGGEANQLYGEGDADTYCYSTGDFISDKEGGRDIWGYGWMIVPDEMDESFSSMAWISQ